MVLGSVFDWEREAECSEERVILQQVQDEKYAEQHKPWFADIVMRVLA